MKLQTCEHIENERDIVTIRHSGRDLARRLGFGTVDQARITTAISELARNILLYAGSGEICIGQVVEGEKNGLMITAEDKGPGIADIRRAMEDGYTTSGGLGVGLPGIRRLMDSFDIRSKAHEGAKITVIKWLG